MENKTGLTRITAAGEWDYLCRIAWMTHQHEE
jgi:hypothetical protein